jgi:uncharacterized cupredoxin-like copper-binding protein
MKVRKRSVVVAAALTVALVLAAVALARPAATAIAVTAGKPGPLNFTLTKKTAPKGVVSFKVTNKGALKHDFKINGKKTVLLAPGKSVTLKVTFTKAGRYPYLCTVPGHAQAGMKGVFVVK